MKNNQFQISQLRQDKIIYAVEAVVVNSFCLLTFIAMSLMFPLPSYFFYITFAFAVYFTLFALIGNYFRLRKIKQLEKKL